MGGIKFIMYLNSNEMKQGGHCGGEEWRAALGDGRRHAQVILVLILVQ